MSNVKNYIEQGGEKTVIDAVNAILASLEGVGILKTS